MARSRKAQPRPNPYSGTPREELEGMLEDARADAAGAIVYSHTLPPLESTAGAARTELCRELLDVMESTRAYTRIRAAIAAGVATRVAMVPTEELTSECAALVDAAADAVERSGTLAPWPAPGDTREEAEAKLRDDEAVYAGTRFRAAAIMERSRRYLDGDELSFGCMRTCTACERLSEAVDRLHARSSTCGRPSR